MVQTRADVLFDCCELASNLKNATATDMIASNETLKKPPKEVVVCIPQLKNDISFKIGVYSDSSYANLKDSTSQGGFITFLTGTEGVNLSPIAWESKIIKDVVKSALAAEMLALVDAAEACLWLQSVIL